MKKTLFKLLLFLLLVYGGKIHAQNVYMSENGNFTNAEGGIFIDFNNDGKMDYLDSPNYAGGVLNLYRNTGTGMVLEQTLNTQEYVNYFYHSRHGEDKEAYYADFNEDGVKDLLLYASNHAYCGNNVIRIYWGSATYPYFANANYLTLSANSPYCVGAVAVDFNNDGRRDVHVRSASGVNTMLRNDGGGVFTSVPTFNTGRDISQFFYDIDGDGIQDLVYGKNGWADGQFGFRYNKGLGNGDFNSTTQIYYDAQGVREWDVMPINGNPLTDNKMDVALIALNDGTNANTLYLGQYNNGTDNFTFTTQSIGTNFPDQRLIASLDYNNDGFMDILNSYKTASSPSRWTTRILQNNGNGVFTVGATIFENQPYYPTQIAKGNNGQVLLSTRLLNVAENAVTSVTVWELQPPTIPSSSIVVAPLSLNFGDVLVGATHTQTFSITNTTSNPINIVNVAYPSNFSGDFSTGVISANSTQTVTVTFTPNAAQTSNANIQINAYGVVSSYSINVIGNGIVCAAPTFSLPASACINASTIPLVGSPAGGVFTINGATATSLEPSVLGAGNHTVVYTSPLCANPETKVITINPLPTLSFIGLNSTYCVNGDNVNLQASPAGGLFMVDGLNATYIHPATLGVGTHPIVYGYTDANGCSNTITQNITITDLPTVSFVNNASLLVEDDFSTPASQNNWTMVETQNGGGTFSVASGNQLYTAGGSNGYMGQPDGFTIKATYPNMPTDYTNKEISLNLEQVSITQYGANKGNVGSRFIIGNGGSGAYFSGTPLQNGIMIMQYGFYRGYAPDPPYSYNVWSGNTVEIWQGVSGNWSKITTLNYPIFEYQNLDFKVVHQGGSWKVLHKKSIETSYSTVIIPDFNLTANLTCFFYHGSGDGGYTYQNAQAITHINAFQIKDLSVASTLPTSVCALSAPFDLLASPSGGVFAVNGTSATQFNPTMLGTGTHMVSYTYTNATCTNTITQNVTINPLPTLSFVGLNNTYPVDMVLSWLMVQMLQILHPLL
jgi:hypothetical protein